MKRVTKHRSGAGSGDRRQGGFIISLELMLILTILVIGTFVGCVAVRNALFQVSGSWIAHSNRIFDSTTPEPLLVGKAKTFDLCEAPQIICRDPLDGRAALLGVRPDRFTSRDRVYYTGPNCTGIPFLAPPGNPAFSVGYFNALQSVSFGVGAPSTWPADPALGPGTLYRADAGPTTAVTILSVWTSQNPDCTFQPPMVGSGGAPITAARWEFTGNSPLPTVTAPGVLASPVIPFDGPPTPGSAHIGPGPCNTRGALTEQNNATICSFSQQIDPLHYLEITLGCAGGTYDPSSFEFRARRAGAGSPANVYLLASDDGFVTSEIVPPGGIFVNSVGAFAMPLDWTLYSFDLDGLDKAVTWSFRLLLQDVDPPGGFGEIRFDNFDMKGACSGLGTGGGASGIGTEVCTDLPVGGLLDLLPATAVRNADNTMNILDIYTPPFQIPPPGSEPLILLEPVPEGAPMPTTGTPFTDDPIELTPPVPEGTPNPATGTPPDPQPVTTEPPEAEGG